MKVILSNEAKEDMNHIFNFILKDSLKYAIRTDVNIRLYIHKLEHYPYIGRYVSELCDKSFRELIYKNYRIVYQVSKKLDAVYVHFIVHGKRNFKSYYKSYIKNNF